MMTQTTMPSQGLLFSEPLYSETGVWCELREGIDPEEWAGLCRSLGSLSPKRFRKVRKKVYGSPDTLLRRLKRLFMFDGCQLAETPILSLGPSGIGGEFQRESYL